MPRYRQKPVVVEVEAVQWFPGTTVPGVAPNYGNCGDPDRVYTSDGRTVLLNPGDWVVAQPDGRGYVVMDERTFARLFEPVAEPADVGGNYFAPVDPGITFLDDEVA
jgi:hypothetical protein